MGELLLLRTPNGPKLVANKYPFIPPSGGRFLLEGTWEVQNHALGKSLTPTYTWVDQTGKLPPKHVSMRVEIHFGVLVQKLLKEAERRDPSKRRVELHGLEYSHLTHG